MSMRRWKICSRVFGAAAALALSLSGPPATAQMDDVTMPGGEKKATPSLLSESEFNEWAAKPGAVVFDLQYRGLTEKEADQAIIFGGFGTSHSPETEFTRSVGLEKRKSAQVPFPLLKGSEEGVVEFEEKTIWTLYLGKRKIKALYLDLDCDGKLGAGERMEPVRVSSLVSRGMETLECFITPEFSVSLLSGRKAPFRLMAQIKLREGRPAVSMVAPLCFWEGNSKVGNTETFLRLMDYNTNGSFMDFGEDSFQLVQNPTGSPNPTQIPDNALSRLIRFDNNFYQFHFTGDGTKEKPLRAVLCRDTTPTGRIQIKLALGPNGRMESARLVSAETPTILFDILGSDLEVPEGDYRIERGNLCFGNGAEMAVFRPGPKCRIVADQITSLELGNPKLRLEATAETKTDTKPTVTRTSFPSGTDIRLNIKMVGKAEEEYVGVVIQSKNKNLLESPKVQIQISGPNGKRIESSDLEFG